MLAVIGHETTQHNNAAAADQQESQVSCGAHVLYGEAAAEVAVVRGVRVPGLPDRRSLRATQPRTQRLKDIKSQNHGKHNDLFWLLEIVCLLRLPAVPRGGEGNS